MNHVLHLVVKDLRRLKWVALGWLALILTLLVTSDLMFERGDPGLWIQGSLRFGAPLILALFVCHLVQDEPLVGSDAFWTTKPIDSSSLLVSKSILLIVLVVLPVVLAEAIALADFDLGARRLAFGLGESLGATLAWTLGAACVASLTRNFRHFVLFGFAVALASRILPNLFVTALGIGASAATGNNPPSLPDIGLVFRRFQVQELTSMLIVLLFSGLVLFLQYRRRSSILSHAMLGVGLTLLIGAVVRPSAMLALMGDRLTGQYQLSSKDISVEIETYGSSSTYPGKVVARFGFSSSETALALLGFRPSNLHSESRDRPLGFNTFDPPWGDERAVAAALGTLPVPDSEDLVEIEEFELTRDIPSATFPSSEPARGEVEFLAYRYRKVAELPLAVGSRGRGGGYRVTLHSVRATSGWVEINVVVQWVTLLLEDLEPLDLGHLRFFLVDDRRRLPIELGSSVSNPVPPPSLVSVRPRLNSEAGTRSIRVALSDALPRGEVGFDHRHVRLIALKRELLGRLTRSFELSTLPSRNARSFLGPDDALGETGVRPNDEDRP